MNIPQAYDMLELIDELNHVRGIEFAYALLNGTNLRHSEGNTRRNGGTLAGGLPARRTAVRLNANTF